MQIATILFTYNRPFHTERVLSALRQNTEVPQILYIFQDGQKENTNLANWNKVNEIINKVNFCPTEIIVSPNNRGLSDSVVEGINYVFQDNDAIIVLEDDCVPHSMFMKYMVDSLKKYSECEQVYNINGSNEDVDVTPNGYDAYFMGRINSWGWGTWKNRWKKFDRNYRLITKIKSDNNKLKWLEFWGQDLESYVINNVYGKNDSWATFWALTVIDNKGLCLSPYKSLINNIGFDGTGTHCGIQFFDSKMEEESKKEFRLPNEIQVIESYEEDFKVYRHYINPNKRDYFYRKLLLKWLNFRKDEKQVAEWFRSKNINEIYVWGTGEIGKLLLDELNNKIKVIAFIDLRTFEKKFQGIPVISYNSILDTAKYIVVVPGYDFDYIKRVIGSKYTDKLINIEDIFNTENI